MASQILLIATVLLICIFSDRLSGKIGVPALLLFIGIGILFGTDGILKIPFEDYGFASAVCEVALIIIMFTGGFAVKWDTARPVVVKSCLLSTLGVVITAAVTMLFCRLVLNIPWSESFLLGAVISSTDAASVFSVLRSRRLNLKNGLAPLLEVESGSNDPFSYMLTAIALALLKGQGAGFVWYLVFSQIVFGVLGGVLVGLTAVFIAKRVKTSSDGFEVILFLASSLLAYALPALLNGNGYLAVYIAGVIMGNTDIPKKREAVTFLNGITGLAQIAVFFMLGLLCTPSTFHESIIPSLLIYLCLTLLSRPAAVLLLCGRSSVKERTFISFAGLRGASSIVFAIMATVDSIHTQSNIFNIVFCVCLLSMVGQGSLLPFAAKKLRLIDDNSDVLKTFNDYKEESSITMMRMFIPPEHPWADKRLSEVTLPTGSLAVMIKRGEENIIPKGSTVIRAEDSVVLSVPPYDSDHSFKLREIRITEKHRWAGKNIRELELPEHLLVVMIKRDGDSVIPSGATHIMKGDIVVVTDSEYAEAIVSQ